MNKELEVVLALYDSMVSMNTVDGIPVDLKPTAVIGTVQDDPFDCWVESKLKQSLHVDFEVFHAGKLTTPDLILRDRKTNTVIGLEIKKLIQTLDGRDPRGLTIDYNSCLPCGRTMIKVGKDTIVVPCYYLFALLNHDSTKIVTLIIMDGDFINYDFELYKEAKYSNFTEYNHGSYGDGSVRHRKMYTYPNPLNSNLSCFSFRQLIVAKKSLIDNTVLRPYVHEEIVRTDRYGNSFYYCLVDKSGTPQGNEMELMVFTDVFKGCRTRQPKERVAYIPTIPEL